MRAVEQPDEQQAHPEVAPRKAEVAGRHDDHDQHADQAEHGGHDQQLELGPAPAADSIGCAL